MTYRAAPDLVIGELGRSIINNGCYNKMTLPYQWNPMPYKIDIVCPKCQKDSKFEFAELVTIQKRKDIEFFKKSKHFEYVTYVDSCGHKKHGAIFFFKIHGTTTESIEELPEGFDKRNWDHSRDWSMGHNWELGSVYCSNCQHIAKHELQWPNEAFYKIEYKSQILWAPDLKTMVALKDYIESEERDTNKHGCKCFLMKIPEIFLARKARNEIVKKINKKLKINK